jgi:carbon starvation protein CstA
VISPEQILQTAKDIGEPSVLNRAGGAPTLAGRRRVNGHFFQLRGDHRRVFTAHFVQVRHDDAKAPEQILQTAKDIGEPSVLNRAGGAPTLAVGIAHVARVPASSAVRINSASNRIPKWYQKPISAIGMILWLCCRICWVTSCRS